MPAFEALPIRTERLLLRPLRESDADELFAIFSNPEVMRYGSSMPWSSVERAREVIKRDIAALESGEHVNLAIERIEDSRLIGHCTLFKLNSTCRRAEIGYTLAARFWGNGYMNEALRALIGYGFDHMDLNRIEADVDPRNVRSVRTLERLGFEREGLLKERWIVNGKVSDSALYGLLRRHWPPGGETAETRMPDRERVLSPTAARACYDRFGKMQDSQGFYENPALDDLIAHADFQDARNVFEFGCGTGKFAARLFEQHLHPSANYLGCDISPVMVGLAKRRLAAYVERAQVILTDAGVRFPCSDHSADRVVATYVLDLLSKDDIRRFFSEARRVTVPGGKVCLASLTSGTGYPSRIVSSLWMAVFRLNPAIVGGCRPIHLDDFVSPDAWQIVHRRIVSPFAVPSEVLVLSAKGPN